LKKKQQQQLKMGADNSTKIHTGSQDTQSIFVLTYKHLLKANKSLKGALGVFSFKFVLTYTSPSIYFPLSC